MDNTLMRSCYAEINLKNLSHNIEQIKKRVKQGTTIVGIIKADGYGHGSYEVARTLLEKGITAFGVATLKEAVTLREKGIREEIIILGITDSDFLDVICKYDLTPVIRDYENAKALSLITEKEREIFLPIDTGMGRIGYPVTLDMEKALSEFEKISKLSNIKIKGLFSHMATADEEDKAYSIKQKDAFIKFNDLLVKRGIDLPVKTMANSASVMEIPEVYYDMVRPGIMLYGQMPSQQMKKEGWDLKPVMSVKAKIIYLKDVGEGFYVSYGRTFVTERKSKIATLSLGYADGLPRNYSNIGKVIINGVYAPIVGNICMDQCMIDVTDVPNVKLGDTAVIMGEEAGLKIEANDIGKATGTINYEVVCRFGQRLERVYIK